LTKDLTNFIAMARWVAAFAVLVGHAGVIINISDIMVGPHGPGVYAWWFLAAYSHQAVLVFFVISGFLVGGPLLRDRARETPFLHEYFVDRFSRIYIVMVPALLWTFAIDSVGRAAFPATGVYDAPFFASVFAPIQYLWTLLQQQHLWAAQAGTNGPLWSLACEMWYYITFPLLLLPLSRAYPKTLRMGGLALGASLVVFLATPEIMAAFGVDVGAYGLMPMMNNGVGMFLFGYGVWVLGALARVAPRPAVKSVWIALVLFLAALAVTRLAVRGPLLTAHPWLSALGDFSVVASFALLLLALRHSPGGGVFSRLGPIHWRLSDFSYSLYATHAPLVFFVWAAVGGIFGRDWFKELPTPTHWLIAFGVIVSAVGFAYAFSRVTEARTKELRDALRGLRLPLARRGAAAVRALD
jgi:peptidoglycan/LPS O-acetylase OafA/YrhL